ncbi:hypothetical protein PINS_up006732 [Pythium insidiosum]|nr:hypothetical protein PINS_up006732 [Pythium insidiosum]
MTTLAPSVLLAFDDFSLAGSYLVRHATVSSGRCLEPETLTPNSINDTAASASASAAAILPYVRVQHFHLSQDSARPELSTVVIHSAALQSSEYALWEVAKAIISLLSASDVRELTIVASLHLPDAKPQSAALDNVYFAPVASASPPDEQKTDASASQSLLFDGSGFAPFDGQWEIRNALLTRLLHLLRVDRSVSTAVLLAKGYRPGRDGAGTRDAMEALELALQRYSRGVLSFDRQAASRDAALALQATTATKASELALLYQ